jgi:hypothetical protein
VGVKNEVLEGVVPQLGPHQDILACRKKLEEVARLDYSIDEAITSSGGDVQVVVVSAHTAVFGLVAFLL